MCMLYAVVNSSDANINDPKLFLKQESEVDTNKN